MAEYSCVILAGGKGERLYPVTQTRPKPLCTVGGCSVLERCIKSALDLGITDITVTACYMADEIKKAVSRYKNVKVHTENEPLGSAGGAAACVDGKNPVLVLSGDGVNTFDLRLLIENHEKNGCICTVAVTSTPYPTEFGVVTSKDGEVVSFDEKPFWSHVRSDKVNTGIYVLSPRVFSFIPKGRKSDFSSDLFPKLFENGEKIGCFELEGYWCDVGTPQALRECALKFSDGVNAVSASASIAGSAFVTSSLIMENVKIGDGAVIDSAVICENVTVGRDVLIPEGCVVGADTVIGDDTVLGRGVTLEAGTRIEEGESVMNDVFGRAGGSFDWESGSAGIYGRSFLPSDAFSVGASLAYCAGDGRKIGVCYADDDRSSLIGGAMSDGVRYGGGTLYVLGNGFSSLSSFCAREYGLDYSAFVSVNENCGVVVRIFGTDGMRINSREAHRIKNACLRLSDGAQTIKKAVVPCDFDAPLYLYSTRLIASSQGLDGVSVCSEEANRTSELLNAVVKKLGADTKTTGKARFAVSDDGEDAFIVTESGKKLGKWQLICFLLGEEASYRHNVFVPEDAPLILTRYAASKGAVCIRDSEKAKDIRFRDGCFLCLSVFDTLKRKGMTFDAMASEIPGIFIKTAEYDYTENKKAEKMRLLCEECGGNDPVFTLEHGFVRFYPLPKRGFRVIAEATSSEFADELFDFAEKKLK